MSVNDSRGEAVIRREERKLERARASTEAAEQNMTKTIAAFMRDKNTKRAIVKDAIDAKNNPRSRADIMTQAGEGTFQDREIVTGDEPRPWED